MKIFNPSFRRSTASSGNKGNIDDDDDDDDDDDEDNDAVDRRKLELKNLTEKQLKPSLQQFIHRKHEMD